MHALSISELTSRIQYISIKEESSYPQFMSCSTLQVSVPALLLFLYIDGLPNVTRRLKFFDYIICHSFASSIPFTVANLDW